ncbi:MAG TPA: hypothetical protein VMW69_08385 [Spirochaetia bacterium]|nr:hypothetical protein [Spirochaetia bacterium]
MYECPYVDDCTFLSRTIADLPDVAFLMKARHCERGHEACARYILAERLGRERVPDELYPNQMGKAGLILDQQLGTHPSENSLL